jgi:hypothetical protein
MKPAPITRLLGVLFLCLALAACTGLFKNYGRIDPSQAVTLAVENREVSPQYRYYISGSDLYPNALMGLHRDYRLDPETLWREVQMTPKLMEEIVWGIKTRAFQVGAYPAGFDLLDNQGRPIGIWYSIFSARTFLRMGEDGIVRIDTPDPETYDKLEPRTDN